MSKMESDDPVDHIKAGHRVQAQWTVWTTQNVKLGEDGTLRVLVDTQRILDDTAGDTEWWCSECDQLAEPDAAQVEYTDERFDTFEVLDAAGVVVGTYTIEAPKDPRQIT